LEGLDRGRDDEAQPDAAAARGRLGALAALVLGVTALAGTAPGCHHGGSATSSAATTSSVAATSSSSSTGGMGGTATGGAAPSGSSSSSSSTGGAGTGGATPSGWTPTTAANGVPALKDATHCAAGSHCFAAILGGSGTAVSQVTLAAGSQNIAAVVDAWGSGQALAAPPHSVVPLGKDSATGQPYAAFRQANYDAAQSVAPALAGSGIASTAANAPWTMGLVVAFLSTPAGQGKSTLDGMIQVGGTVEAASPAGAVFMGTSRSVGAGQVVGQMAGASQDVAPWGTDQLADGTAGDAAPSFQFLLYAFDGAHTSLWVDGVRVAGPVARTFTASSTGFALGPYLDVDEPPDADVYAAFLLDYVPSVAVIKAWSRWAAGAYGFPPTAARHTLVGDSIGAGYFDTIGTNDFMTLLPAYAGAVPVSTHLLTKGGNWGQDGWSSWDALNIPPTSGWSGATATYQESVQAEAISTRTVSMTCSYEFGVHDLDQAKAPDGSVDIAAAEAALQVDTVALVAWLRSIGCAQVLAHSLEPMDATALTQLAPGFAAQRTVFNAWLGGGGSGADRVLDWDATGDATPSVTGTCTAIAPTIGGLATAFAGADNRYVDHIHLGSSSGPGTGVYPDGGMTYACNLLAQVQIMRGLRNW
jgi:hypothetical protein